jgi:hypothetical protein
LAWNPQTRGPKSAHSSSSYKAGLRAKEIASLKWSMVMDADGDIGDHVHLTNEASNETH